MPDDVQATPAAETAAPAPANAMAKFVAAAEAEIAQAAGSEAEDMAAAAPPAEKGARDENGRFLPKGGKTAEAGAEAEETPAKAKSGALDADKTAKPKAEPPKTEARLAQIRELADKGKLEEAFVAAFGKMPDELLTSKQWKAWRHENGKVAGKLAEAREQIDADRQIIQRAAADFAPLIEARKAWEAGDPEAAIKHAFGIEFNAFQKLALQKFHGTDPEKVALRRELAEVRKLIEDKDEQARKAQHQSSVEQARAAHRNQITEQLQASEDERFTSRADKKAFVDRVFKIQAAHYDKRTDTTLPILEAAEMAWDEIAEEFGFAPPVNTAPKTVAKSVRGAPSAASGPGRTPARQAARAANPLNQSEAAEASAPPNLKGDDLRRYFVRLAESAIASERIQ